MAPQGSILPSPERRRAAIKLLEEDDTLSDNDFCHALQLFRKNTSTADTFLAISKKARRTAYIQLELEGN
jgi:hypothetical protein